MDDEFIELVDTGSPQVSDINAPDNSGFIELSDNSYTSQLTEPSSTDSFIDLPTTHSQPPNDEEFIDIPTQREQPSTQRPWSPALRPPPVKDVKGALGSISQPVPEPEPPQDDRSFLGKVGESWKRGRESWGAAQATGRALVGSVPGDNVPEVIQDITGPLSDLASNKMTEQDIKRLQPYIDKQTEIEQRYGADPVTSKNKVAKAIYGAAESAGGMFDSMVKAWDETLAGAGLGAAAGALGGGVGAAAGAVIGAKKGWDVGRAKEIYFLSAGQMYRDNVEKGIDPTIAKNTALLGAIPYAATEFVFDPFSSKMFTKFFSMGISKQMAKKTIDKAMLDIGKKVALNYGKSVGLETSEEGIQQVIDDLTGNVAAYFDNKKTGGNRQMKEANEMLKDGINAMIQSVGPVMVMMLPGIGFQGFSAATRLHQIKANQTSANQQFDSLRKDFGDENVTRIDEQTIGVTLPNGKQLTMAFQNDISDYINENPQDFIDSIKAHGKNGILAVKEAMNKADGDVREAAHILNENDEWTANGIFKPNATITDEAGNQTTVDAYIALENGWSSKGSAAHEVWHAVKELAGITEQEQAKLDKLFGGNEEYEAYAFERHHNKSPVFKRISMAMQRIISGNKETSESEYQTISRIKEQALGRLKAEGAQKETHVNLTPTEKQEIAKAINTGIPPKSVQEQAKLAQEAAFTAPEPTIATEPIPEPTPAIDKGVQAEKTPVKDFAQRIVRNEDMSSPVDQEFYQNNAPAVEAELQRLEQEQADTLPAMLEPSESATSTVNAEITEAPAGRVQETGAGMSIKNASTAKLREEIGAEKRKKPTKRAWEKVSADAKVLYDSDPEATRQLVNDLLRNPEQTITDTQNALLVHETQARYDRLQEARKAEERAETPEAKRIALESIDIAKDALNEIIEIDERAGTALGRGLVARRMILRQDWSVVNMLRQRKAANNGKTLSKEQIEKTEKRSAAIAKAQEAVDAHEEKRIDTAVEKQVEKIKRKKKKVRTKEEILNQVRQEAGITEPTEGVKFSVSQADKDADSRYLELAKNPEKNRAELQKMVDEAAEELGFTKPVYHGSRHKGFTQFEIPSKGFNSNFMGSWEIERNAAFFSSDMQTAKEFSEQGNVKNGETRRFLLTGLYLDMDTGLDESIISELADRGVNRKWIESSNHIWEFFDSDQDPDGVFVKALKDMDYDGVNFLEEGGTSYAVLDPSTIKLADPITYDDQGNVIPLSQRFDDTKPDIRFSVTNINESRPSFATVEDLARFHIEEGLRDPFKVIAAIHDDLKDIFPDITERDVKIILSKYGQTDELSPLETDRMLRETKAQSRLSAAIADALEGKLPKKTGLQRDKATPAVRNMIRDLRNLLKANGLNVKTDEQRMATALDSIKTRLRNQITDLERQIKTGERDGKKNKVEWDAEAKQLKAERDRLKAVIADIDGKPGLTDQQKIKNAEKSIDRAIAKYERRIREGDLAPAKKAISPQSPELTKKREKAQQLRDALKEFKKEANKSPFSDELQALKKLHARLNKNIAMYEEKIKNKDFAVKTRKEIELDEKGLQLTYELEQIKHKWQEDLFQDRIDNMTPRERVYHEVANLFNAVKAMVTSFDISGFGRQGGWFLFTHPKIALKTMFNIRKVAFDEVKDFAVNDAIKKRKNYHLYKKYRLGITDTSNTAAVWLKEEEYAFRESIAGNIVKKIPGILASQRAYVTYLNIARATYFDMLVDKLLAKGVTPTESDYKNIAALVRDATGRASLGKYENASLAAATIFFSPRFVVSRFRILLGSSIWSSDAELRKLIATEYARYAAGLLGVISLLGLAGNKPEEDPRSSAFGKIKIGDTYLDLMSGFQQPLVFLARLITGERKTALGTIRKERGEDAAFGASTLTTINQFIRSKLAPIPGAALNLITGKDYIGEEKKPWEVLTDLPIPLIFKDTYQAMRVEGIPAGMAMGIMATLGASVSTQEEKSQKILKEGMKSKDKAQNRKAMGQALDLLNNNMQRAKLDIKRKYAKEPEKMRTKFREVNKELVEKKKELRKIFLGMDEQNN